MSAKETIMPLTNEARGVFPIAPTPFLPSGEIDWASVDRLFDFYREFFDDIKSIDKDTAPGSNVVPFAPRATSPAEGD